MTILSLLFKLFGRCQHCGQTATRLIHLDSANSPTTYTCERCLPYFLPQAAGGIFIGSNRKFSIWNSTRPYGNNKQAVVTTTSTKKRKNYSKSNRYSG